MQQAIEQSAVVALPSGDTVALPIKAAVASGSARRFLVGDPNIQLTDTLAGETLPPILVKGKSEPVPVARLVGVGKAQARVESTADAGLLVGRETELVQLVQCLQPLFAGEAARFAGVVYVHGEAGVGKSRLAYELRHVCVLYCVFAFRTQLSEFHHNLTPGQVLMDSGWLFSSLGIRLVDGLSGAFSPLERRSSVFHMAFAPYRKRLPEKAGVRAAFPFC